MCGNRLHEMEVNGLSERRMRGLQEILRFARDMPWTCVAEGDSRVWKDRMASDCRRQAKTCLVE